MLVRASYYQQFDADFALDEPAEGYSGWRTDDLEISSERTALVVMHAWDCGSREQYPGWYRAVEYLPRAQRICHEVFPTLLSRVRSSPLKLFHVVGGGDYYRDCPGYLRAVDLAGQPKPALDQIDADDTLTRLRRFRADNVFVGSHNREDVRRGFQEVGFPAEARPLEDEGVAENGHQLFALCRDAGVNHLIYTGFAINWCLLLSPGGMHEMNDRGVMCSVIPEAVTAVENRETAREELCKSVALWRVALAFGFVFGLDDFLQALKSLENVKRGI